MPWFLRDIADFKLPEPESFFAALIMITVALAFFLLSGCNHQPPGDGLYLLVR